MPKIIYVCFSSHNTNKTTLAFKWRHATLHGAILQRHHRQIDFSTTTTGTVLHNMVHVTVQLLGIPWTWLWLEWNATNNLFSQFALTKGLQIWWKTGVKVICSSDMKSGGHHLDLIHILSHCVGWTILHQGISKLHNWPSSLHVATIASPRSNESN